MHLLKLLIFLSIILMVFGCSVIKPLSVHSNENHRDFLRVNYSEKLDIDTIEELKPLKTNNNGKGLYKCYYASQGTNKNCLFVATEFEFYVLKSIPSKSDLKVVKKMLKRDEGFHKFDRENIVIYLKNYPPDVNI